MLGAALLSKLAGSVRLQQWLHFQQDLFTPLLQTVFTDVVLIDLIKRQADKVLTIGAQCFEAAKFEAIGWLEADELYA